MNTRKKFSKLFPLVLLGFALLVASGAEVITAPAQAAEESVRLLWADRFGEPERNEVPGSDAVAAADGAVFVAGGIGEDFLVRAYRANDGTLLWNDIFDRSGHRDFALGVTAADGRVFASGGDFPPDSVIGIPVIRAYESQTGRLLWHQEVADSRGTFDSSVVHEETVVAVGGNLAWLVQAYDTKNGTPRWGDRFGARPGGNRAISVAEQGGRVFVGGRARLSAFGTLDWFVRAYNASSGNVLWEDHSPAGFFSQVNSIAVEGNYVIAVGSVLTETNTPPFFNTDWRIRAYDANSGALLWEDVVDKGGAEFPEVAEDVAIRGGKAFVVGSGGAGCSLFVNAPDNCDFIVRAYEIRTGQLLWEDQLDRAPYDEAVSVAANAGGVFVTGLGGNNCDNSGLTNCDLFIRAYKPNTGILFWEDQVDYMGTNDAGLGIAARDGKIFAAGVVANTDLFGFADLLVRAYDFGDDDN